VRQGVVFVGLLEDEEGGFLLALVGYEAFAVEAVLDVGEDADGGAEIHEDPSGVAAQVGDVVEHGDLVAVDVGLVFLGPALGDGTVEAGLGSSAEFTDDEGLIG
jgi:hypothetical protein